MVRGVATTARLATPCDGASAGISRTGGTVVAVTNSLCVVGGARFDG